MQIIVTGGAGYIGNVICHQLKDAGFEPLIVDNMSAGHARRLDGFKHIIGSIGSASTLEQVRMAAKPPYVIVHCAASIVVPESVSHPLGYMRNNVAETLQFLDGLSEDGPVHVILSSTGSMYENAPDVFSVDEDARVAPVNPYSLSKYVTEQLLAEAARLGKINFLSLRYFNPIGCDRKFRSGPMDSNPTHILGSMLRAFFEEKPFVVRGTDWNTRDGTTLRDYIDVADLAEAHMFAIKYVLENTAVHTIANREGIPVVNLGTGFGTTVREFLLAFQSALNQTVLSEDGPRRQGDVRGTFCNADKAKSVLGWQARTEIGESIKNSLKWMNTA
jgi:UDP-glucose 4-epimerase